jgi:hypothetical protein
MIDTIMKNVPQHVRDAAMQQHPALAKRDQTLVTVYDTGWAALWPHDGDTSDQWGWRFYAAEFCDCPTPCRDPYLNRVSRW